MQPPYLKYDLLGYLGYLLSRPCCHVVMFRPADQVPVPGIHHLRPEELPPLRPELRRRLELREGDGPRAGHGGGDTAAVGRW